MILANQDNEMVNVCFSKSKHLGSLINFFW
jgi:hypothetical protein